MKSSRGYEKLILKKNFRSSSSIIDVKTQLHRWDIKDASTLPYDDRIQGYVFEVDTSEARAVGEFISTYVKINEGSRITVLSPSNQLLSE